MDKVKNELDKLFNFIEDFNGETGSNLVVVAFVDDLDRCLEGRNVKVLEAIQLMLSVPGAPVIAFLAIDSRIVVSSIEETFGEVMRSAYISGWEYLDKIVQLSFAVPEPPALKMQRLARSCLQGNAAKPDEVKKMLKRHARFAAVNK